MGNKNIKAGFSLVEIAVVIVIMGIMAAMIVISPNAAKQTAKREAERVQAYIYRLMQKSDRLHVNFNINADKDHIWVKFEGDEADDTSFKPSPGCQYTDNFNGNCKYNPNTKVFNQSGHIDVTGADDEIYRVYLATINEGRIRIVKIYPTT